MKRLVFAIATAILFASASLFAQGGGHKPPKPQAPAAKPTKPTTPASATKPVSSKPVAPKSSPPKAAAAQQPKPKTFTASAKPAPKTQMTSTGASAHGKALKPEKTTVTAKADAKTSKTDARTAEADSKKANTTVAETSLTLPPTGPLTPIQQKLQKNTNLARKLESRLPAGTNVLTASEGFRNLGQFVAAVNVSNNLGIPFADLKEKMVTEHLSLGQAIQALKPSSSGTIEARRAEYDARGLIAETERETQVVVESNTGKSTGKSKVKPSTTTSSKKPAPRASGGRP